MNLDWLLQLLPIINAAGIPILAIGIILLLRAYQNASKSYQETSEHLKIENERLRARLREEENQYFLGAEKIKELMSKSIEAMGQLEARKVALLSNTASESKDELKAEVEKLNRAIEIIHKLVTYDKERQLDAQHSYLRLTSHIGELIGQIGDIKSRIALLGVITSKEEQQEIKKELSGHKRGLVIEKKYPENWQIEDAVYVDREEPTLMLSGEVEKIEASQETRADDIKKELVTPSDSVEG